jgi:CPA2 family monovalent cation:H+ antiporter-2
VLFSAALAAGVIDEALAQLLLAVVVLTLVSTPLLAAEGARLERGLDRRPEEAALATQETGDLRDHVVIAGFGRVGQTVAKLLTSANIGWVAVDRDVELVATARQNNLPVYFGDASGPAMLRSIGIERARAAVVTLDHVDAAERAVEGIQRARPGLPVVARARDIRHAERLRRIGASEVVMETLEASLQLAGKALQSADANVEVVAAAISAFRDGDSVLLQELSRDRRGG